MPRAAISIAEPDQVLALDAIAPALARLCGSRVTAGDER
jgi:chemotaxis response regulator CheB